MAASRLLSTVQSAPKRGRQGSFGGRIGPFVHASHKEDSSTLAEARICEAGFMAKKNRRYPEKKKELQWQRIHRRSDRQGLSRHTGRSCELALATTAHTISSSLDGRTPCEYIQLNFNQACYNLCASCCASTRTASVGEKEVFRTQGVPLFLSSLRLSV